MASLHGGYGSHKLHYRPQPGGEASLHVSHSKTTHTASTPPPPPPGPDPATHAPTHLAPQRLELVVHLLEPALVLDLQPQPLLLAGVLQALQLLQGVGRAQRAGWQQMGAARKRLASQAQEVLHCSTSSCANKRLQLADSRP